METKKKINANDIGEETAQIVEGNLGISKERYLEMANQYTDLYVSMKDTPNGFQISDLMKKAMTIGKTPEEILLVGYVLGSHMHKLINEQKAMDLISKLLGDAFEGEKEVIEKEMD